MFLTISLIRGVDGEGDDPSGYGAGEGIEIG